MVDLSFKAAMELAEKPKGRAKPSAFFNAVAGEQGFDPDSGIAILNLHCLAGAEHRKKKLVDCKATFVVMYEGLQGCDQRAVSGFLARVGRFAGYPYFRSLFSVLTWNAEAGMPPLPVLREPRKKPAVSLSGAPEVSKKN